MCLLGSPTNVVQSKPDSNSPKRICNTKEDDLTNVSVPTFPAETGPQQMDVTSLTSAELSELKRDDPFMYYSIPAVRDAALHGKDVDASLCHIRSSCSSVDSEFSEYTVTRRKRISTECHPDLLFEEMFADDDFMASLENLTSDASFSTQLEDGDDLFEGSLYEYLLEMKA